MPVDVSAGYGVPESVTESVLAGKQEPVERGSPPRVTHEWLISDFIISKDFLVTDVFQLLPVVIDEQTVIVAMFLKNPAPLCSPEELIDSVLFIRFTGFAHVAVQTALRVMDDQIHPLSFGKGRNGVPMQFQTLGIEESKVQ